MDTLTVVIVIIVVIAVIAVIGLVVMPLLAVGKAVGGVASGIGGALGGVANFFGGIPNAIGGAFGGAANAIGGALGSVGAALGGAFGSGGGASKPTIQVPEGTFQVGGSGNPAGTTFQGTDTRGVPIYKLPSGQLVAPDVPIVTIAPKLAAGAQKYTLNVSVTNGSPRTGTQWIVEVWDSTRTKEVAQFTSLSSQGSVDLAPGNYQIRVRPSWASSAAVYQNVALQTNQSVQYTVTGIVR